mgnify:FL=1
MGQYKEKSCKYCNKTHRKRGPYCSQSCANKDREPTERMREAMREVAVDYNKTPEAIAKQKLLHTGATIDDFYIEIPEIKDLADYSDYLQGYERGENW